MIAADFDLDNKIDLACPSQTLGSIYVWRGNGDGTFARPHGANQCLLLLAGVADLPDALFEGAGALIIGVTEAGPDKPDCAKCLAFIRIAHG